MQFKGIYFLAAEFLIRIKHFKVKDLYYISYKFNKRLFSPFLVQHYES